MNSGQKFTVFGPGLMAMVLTASPALAQVPVDDGGNVIGTWQDQASATGTGNEGIPLLTRQELQDLVGPVALYPDDLLAIVLPAATYPLQVVQASRFLEEIKSNPDLEPDADWDDAIVALLNYPEIVELLNEDLDWTWRLGEAVVAQQTDVVNAVEAFRNTAYAAGNLRSDEYQQVSRDEGVIEITPVNDDIIYVPYYEPESVVIYQPQPVYFYYERPRPVYYYPYADTYAFHRGFHSSFFWGVTTAFTIGWASDSLHVYHHSYHGHPYYGHHYRTRWWYRQPSIYTHNATYHGGNHYRASNWNSRGDFWRSNRNHHLRHYDQRVTRNTHYTNRHVQQAVTNTRSHTSTHRAVATANQHTSRRQTHSRSEPRHETRYVARNEPRHETRYVARNEPRHETRYVARNEPRHEVRQVARNEPRRESHSEPRRQPRSEPQRESRNHERREQRSESRQSRGREQPRQHKN